MLAKLLPQNEHRVDRAIRVVLGLAALSLTLVGPQSRGGLLGLLPLLTGVLGTCPAYTLLGMSTQPAVASAQRVN